MLCGGGVSGTGATGGSLVGVTGSVVEGSGFNGAPGSVGGIAGGSVGGGVGLGSVVSPAVGLTAGTVGLFNGSFGTSGINSAPIIRAASLF